ncbi:MAG: hypothetical protein ACD_78C00127G0002 [uncultured bacterium (gcode 4)]|uniref:Uncharacterized protein n=1 Tax=uncultured bacterium (gcode 4) TaxID=1234023 RepID=K1XZ24_9BACT|nr:MAG: hypothetical protein ACD_78C00127G0002 [uncultured bacterium (gcode 4)]
MKIEKSPIPDFGYILTKGTDIIEWYMESELLYKYCSRVLTTLELLHRPYDIGNCTVCEKKCSQVTLLFEKG